MRLHRSMADIRSVPKITCSWARSSVKIHFFKLRNSRLLSHGILASVEKGFLDEWFIRTWDLSSCILVSILNREFRIFKKIWSWSFHKINTARLHTARRHFFRLILSPNRRALHDHWNHLFLLCVYNIQWIFDFVNRFCEKSSKNFLSADFHCLNQNLQWRTSLQVLHPGRSAGTSVFAPRTKCGHFSQKPALSSEKPCGFLAVKSAWQQAGFCIIMLANQIIRFNGDDEESTQTVKFIASRGRWEPGESSPLPKITSELRPELSVGAAGTPPLSGGAYVGMQ